MIKRNINVDLFRVIAGIFVVTLHVLGQGGILSNSSPSGTIYWAAWFIEICAYCAVDCFALISGYIMVDKNIKLKSILSLWFQISFYSLIFTSIFFIFVPETRSINNMVISVIPIIGKQWWYISSYFALLLFIPFLNKAINNISKQTYKKFLIVILIGICCFSSLSPTDAFSFKDGYSAIWLMIVYLFGAYIYKYNSHKKITALKSVFSFLAMVILTFLSKIAIRFTTQQIWGQAKFEGSFISYTSITIFLSAIFLFFFCLNLKINHITSKIISLFAPATLGVYLIHVHPLVYNYILKDAFISFTKKPFILMLLYVFIAILSIFLLCSIIELLRIQFFKLIKINKLCEAIENIIKNFYIKIFNK